MTTKEKFLKTPVAARLVNIIDSEEMQTMLGLAFQYFCETHCEQNANNHVGAASANFRIDGARKFREIINTFCLSDTVPIQNASKTLDYNLK